MTRAIPVHGLDDPRLADYRELQALAQRPDPRRFVAESEIVVERLLRSGWPVLSVLGTESHLERLAPAFAGRPEVPAFAAAQATIAAAVGFNFHRGVAACGLRPAGLGWGDMSERTCLEDILASRTGLLAGPRWTVLLAQGLVDPANVGSLVRSARAFAVDLVVFDRAGADPLSRRAIRAAMGHVFTQSVVGATELLDAVGALRGRGARVVAATLGARARPLQGVQRPDRLVVMVGSEGEGLPPELCAAADEEVTIPIDPAVDSLGVAAATPVLLYALAGMRGSAL